MLVKVRPTLEFPSATSANGAMADQFANCRTTARSHGLEQSLTQDNGACIPEGRRTSPLFSSVLRPSYSEMLSRPQIAFILGTSCRSIELDRVRMSTNQSAGSISPDVLFSESNLPNDPGSPLARWKPQLRGDFVRSLPTVARQIKRPSAGAIDQHLATVAKS